MPIFNIVDRRSWKYIIQVTAVFEPSFHDSCREGEITSRASSKNTEGVFKVFYVKLTTIANAIGWINQDYPNTDITMFLYDLNTKEYYDAVTIIVKNQRFIPVMKKVELPQAAVEQAVEQAVETSYDFEDYSEDDDEKEDSSG